MAELPPPIVSAEVDLRGMEYMPLKGDILFKSTTWLKGSHEARSAALRLWWHSFAHEVPAASLPDDDQLLAEYAGYGEVVKAWLKIKPQAMRGWLKCDDGRLYHKIVAELALEAWKGRVKNREKVRKWREKKAAESPSGNGAGNGHNVGDVPVTPPVRNPLKGKREGEVKGERELIKEEESPLAEASPVIPPKAAAASSDALALPVHLDRSVDQAFSLYADAAKANGWPDAMLLNSTRRYALQCRLAECGGLDGWRTALESAKTADFLKTSDGQPQRWFDLDWMLKAEKFTRLMEGRYAERHHDRADERSTTAALAGLREELAR